MAALITLEVLTPHRAFMRDKVEEVIIPLTDGLAGVMAGHSNVVSATHCGIVAVRSEGKWRKAAMAAGMAIITPQVVTILVRSAEWKEDIDVERAKAALHRAEDRLESTDLSWEKARSLSARERARVRLALAEKDAGFTG